MSKGFFGGLFDFDGDGNLDALEKAFDFGAFVSMMESTNEEDLASSGLDIDELELMDDDERREALEDAGFDADDFDF